MTPMIDVVFLLIIFFMIITDLTQQDLEDIQLPVAMTCVPDKPEKGVVRPVINIDHTGKMVVKRQPIYEPEANDMRELEGYLADQARKMPKEYLNVESQSGPKVPDNPLLIRADRNTPFNYVQRIMEICGRKGIQIWKIELAAAEDPEKALEEE